MKVNIVSADERYRFVKELLCKEGVFAQICSANNVDECDFLLLSVKSELSDSELEEVFNRIDKDTAVLCGNDKRISALFNGEIINYSNDNDFLLKNANLTAEAAVSFLHATTKNTLRDKKVFISGYGRIGKELSRILKSLGSLVFAYARRKEVAEEMEKDGIENAPLEKCTECDIIINTVPSVIYSKELTSRIQKDTVIVELASAPYGFECLDGVKIAAALPGKILPYGAAKVVFDTAYNIIKQAKGSAL